MIEDDSIYKSISSAGITAPHNISSWSPLKKVLWILKTAKDNSPANALSPKAISHLAYKLLEENLPEKSIKNTIARAGNTIMKKDNKFYEITCYGRDKLEERNAPNSQKTFYIDGQKPWTDRNSLFPELVSKLQGEILVLDPYYGLGTFHVLSKFSRDKNIKFLTSQIGSNENPAMISKELSRFKKEFKNAELKIYSKFYELHDRYIISDNFLVLVGHGIKDIGDKECFLIGIPAEDVSDIIKNLKQKFKERWAKSNNIT